MKRFTLILATVIFCGHLIADELSLFDCYEKAEKAHPLQAEWRHRQRISELNRDNSTARWLPSLGATANAAYQSDVVDFAQVMAALPFPLPGAFSTMPNEQYKITLDIRQTIYDGGAISAGKKVELATLDAELQSLRTEFYQAREQINLVYFSLLMLEKQAELAHVFRDELLQRRSALCSGVRNGVILPSNLDILDAELLNVEQQIDELVIQSEKARAILSELIDEEAGEATLTLPLVQMPLPSLIQRPEIELFEKQKKTLQMNERVVGSQRLPKAALFGTYGYGQPPGSDFFNDHFDTYYVIGAAVSWDIFDWNSSRRNLAILRAQQNIIDAKRARFEQQIEIALENSRAEIDRIKALLESDEKLTALREKIKDAAAARLNSGDISATEFKTELNAERQARINLEMHKIQLVQAIVQHRTLSGQWSDCENEL